MFISHCSGYSSITRVNMKLAEESIVKNQKYIYEATKIYALKDISRYQRELLSIKELLLIATNRIIDLIKKKYTYLEFIIKNF